MEPHPRPRRFPGDQGHQVCGPQGYLFNSRLPGPEKAARTAAARAATAAGQQRQFVAERNREYHRRCRHPGGDEISLLSQFEEDAAGPLVPGEAAEKAAQQAPKGGYFAAETRGRAAARKGRRP
jgi:hypothetical protein